VAKEREQVLSEFIDAWNAGARPDVDAFLARVPESERAELAQELVSFMSFAPTPEYDEAALEAVREEIAAVEGSVASRRGLLPALLGRLRERMSMSTGEVATALVAELDLPSDRAPKAAGYLERLEQGSLEPARVSRRVFDVLARLFRVPREQLEGAADLSGGAWAPVAAAAPVFRADKEAAADVRQHLEVLADALEAPGGAGRDEIDDLFLGGR
jgi:hypothetical protein